MVPRKGRLTSDGVLAGVRTRVPYANVGVLRSRPEHPVARRAQKRRDRSHVPLQLSELRECALHFPFFFWHLITFFLHLFFYFIFHFFTRAAPQKTRAPLEGILNNELLRARAHRRSAGAGEVCIIYVLNSSNKSNYNIEENGKNTMKKKHSPPSD